MTEREKCLLCVQTNGFALDEAVLFLDTHPDSKEALEYFHKMKSAYESAVQKYKSQYGALCANEVEDRNRWTWNDGCMPWEEECNVEI